MKKRSLLILIISCTLVFRAAAQFPTAYANRLQFVLDSVSALYNIKGVSAAVSVPGLGTWEGVYGISETGVPMTSTMALGIGSNTKTFISSLFLKMEEQSLISLNDSVGTWIQHPNVDGQITIKQLLNHTSGLYSYTNSQAWSNSMTADFTRIWSPDSILQFISTPSFTPGNGWEYSNTNYLLLGLIARQVLGQPLSISLRNNILNPASLNNTWLFPEENVTVTIPHIWSAGFNWAGNFLEDLDATYGYSHNSMMSMAWAAGGIISTASDNANFWSKLIQGQIISPAALVRMKETVNLSSTTSYGLGIFRRKNFNTRTVYSHGGTNLGFINENLADSISGIGISVLTNQDSVSNNILLTKVVAALHKVTLNPPLGVDDIASHSVNITIYPNPAITSINIAGVQEGKTSTIQLYDMTGREVFKKQINSYRNIDLSAHPTGSYIIRVTSTDGSSIGSSLLHLGK